MSHRPYVIAHQGASATCPSNTFASFRAAREMGADIIEIDVTHTRDGVVVVSHDMRVDTCTDGHGYIPEMTLAEVKRLDAGIRKGPRFAGERIPTLEEALAWQQANPIRLCIEVKGDTPEHFLEAGRGTVKLLQDGNSLQPVTLTCFSGDCIRAMKELEPRLSWAFDPDEHRRHTGWELCAQALGYGASFLLHRHDTLTAEIVEEAHQHGLALWTWTVNDPAVMRRAIDLGVDGIMTDCPDVLRAVLEG